MLKKLFSLLLILVGLSPAYAGDLPEISTPENEVWYLIQFSVSGDVFVAQNGNAEVTIGEAKATEDRLWKIVGDDANGFVLTNKKGLTLYADNSNKGTKVKAGSHPSSHHKFQFVKTANPDYLGDFEIQPLGSGNLSMNLFGGPGANNGIGYWDVKDANNCVSFISLKDFENIGKIALIPYPRQLKVVKDGAFPLSHLSTIFYGDSLLSEHLLDFSLQLKKVAGIDLKVEQGAVAPAENALSFVEDKSLPAEGYTLTVEDKNIVVKAAGFAGHFYALQTLKQLLPHQYFGKVLCADDIWKIPYVQIADQPQLSHRGFMLDVGRHFFDKEEVKRLLDVMALYKMNIFHWHLTEDQGWRMEVPEYPRLVEVGSIRKGSYSNPGEGGAFFDDTEYGRGMWYSQEDLKEVVAYAKERNIDIIPEVDFPGHMVAAIAAYPEFSCDPSKEYEVRVSAGISKDVLNVGNDKVIDFLKCIMDNLAKIFPYRYIHFGGDECPTDQWKNNKDCLRRVKEKHLEGVHQLQSWLVEELGTYVKEKYDKDIIVWDELVEHWNVNNSIKPVVMAWRNMGQNKNAADKGLKSITCPADYLYLDMMQVDKNNTLVDEPYFGGWNEGMVITVQKTYGLNPTATLSGREDFCLGVQANMWTETTNDNEELEYQVFPRLLAASEVAWLPVKEKKWMSFYKRLQRHDEILDAKGVVYAKHYIEPAELSATEKLVAEAQEILAESVRGGVGYPSVEVYDQLKVALAAAENNVEDATLGAALKSALSKFKSAPIVQPQPGKLYQIFSASTYYKKQFAGSSLYESDHIMKIHYTPQVEPEELWEFVAADGGYFMQNVGSKQQVSLQTLNKVATLQEEGSVVRVDKATVATRNYSYIPGVVTISNVAGYRPQQTGAVRRLVAQNSGVVNVEDNAALCYPGTWKIVEVQDYSAQLSGLCRKCEHTLRSARPDEVNQPTTEALTFLREKVLEPATEALKGVVTEELFREYMALYCQFLAMPSRSLTDGLDEGYYYFIQNGYFTSHYAAANVSTNKVEPKALNKNSANFYWRIEKQADGQIAIVNKANGKYASLKVNREDADVMLTDQPLTNWTLESVVTNLNDNGIAIVEETGVYGWYTNPNAFKTILLKPKDWGACIWKMVKTSEVTGISDVVADQEVPVVYYDLSGRKVTSPRKGIYIKSTGEKVLFD